METTTRTHRPRIKRRLGERVSHVVVNNVDVSYETSREILKNKYNVIEQRKQKLEVGRQERHKEIDKMFSVTAVKKAAVIHTSLSDLKDYRDELATKEERVNNHYGCQMIRVFNGYTKVTMEEWRTRGPEFRNEQGLTYSQFVKCYV